MPVLIAIALAVAVSSLAASAAGRLPLYLTNGLFAIANFLIVIDDLRAGVLVAACPNGVIGAACAWVWWRGGGGDDTKRRLRKLRGVFQPVRRTAPAA